MEWIGELAKWLSRFFPRIIHLECTDIGLFVTRGAKVRVLNPGVWIFWPLWTTLYRRPANVQTVTMPTQALVTIDGKRVVTGGMIRYKFDRCEEAVRKALVDTEDVEAAITDESLGVFCSYITSLSFDKLCLERAAINRSLTGRLDTVFSCYGVTVLRAQLTDFSPCTTLNHVGFQVRRLAEEE